MRAKKKSPPKVLGGGIREKKLLVLVAMVCEIEFTDPLSMVSRAESTCARRLSRVLRTSSSLPVGKGHVPSN